MLHIATVHYGSPKWVEVQARYLDRHISVPYEVWTSLEGIAPGHEQHFQHVLEQRGQHASKLNHLALEICYVAADTDLLMFLDSDAFPIADPLPLIEDGLSQAPLIAVRRAENADEPQPHPCFCVTTVATWRRLGGDWCGGYTWPGPRGGRISDVGGNLLRRLELSATPWVQLLRSNGGELDPLYFALYADVIYHHGAGSRGRAKYGTLSPTHRALAPDPVLQDQGPPMKPLAKIINRARWKWWERSTEQRISATSDAIYASLQRDDDAWLAMVRSQASAQPYSIVSSRG